MTKLQVKRLYGDETQNPTDGFRVFVDKLWPRGESKSKFSFNLWEKELAPSDSLRTWFHKDPENRWNEFKKQYIQELMSNVETEHLISILKKHQTVTLLFASRDTLHNNAIVLAEYLSSQIGFKYKDTPIQSTVQHKS